MIDWVQNMLRFLSRHLDVALVFTGRYGCSVFQHQGAPYYAYLQQASIIDVAAVRNVISGAMELASSKTVAAFSRVESTLLAVTGSLLSKSQLRSVGINADRASRAAAHMSELPLTEDKQAALARLSRHSGPGRPLETSRYPGLQDLLQQFLGDHSSADPRLHNTRTFAQAGVSIGQVHAAVIEQYGSSPSMSSLLRATVPALATSNAAKLHNPLVDVRVRVPTKDAAMAHVDQYYCNYMVRGGRLFRGVIT